MYMYIYIYIYIYSCLSVCLCVRTTSASLRCAPPDIFHIEHLYRYLPIHMARVHTCAPSTGCGGAERVTGDATEQVV